MTIEDCAAQAVLQWERADAITMVAIAGGESSWINNRASGVDVVGGPGDRPEWRQYACNGVYSWGLWQIHMPSHHDKLYDRTGSTDPCVWRDYLINPGGNASVAHEIWETQGLSAWSVYNNGAYRTYIDQATAAVDEALGVEPVRPVIPRPIWPPTPADFLRLPLVDVLAAPAALFPDTPSVEPPPGFH